MGNKELYLSKRENLVFLSYILLTFLAITTSSDYLYILFFWIIYNVSVGNVKRFFSKKYPIISMVFRRSIYILPYFLSLMYLYLDFSFSPNKSIFYGAGIALGFSFLFPRRQEWLLLLSEDMVSFSKKRKKMDYLINIFYLLGTAIGEEIFFRGVILNSEGFLGINILLSTYLFFLNHYGLIWNKSYSNYDYKVQIVFSFVSILMFIISNSIIPSILMHITYNSVNIIYDIKSYIYHYVKKKENTIEEHC